MWTKTTETVWGGARTIYTRTHNGKFWILRPSDLHGGEWNLWRWSDLVGEVFHASSYRPGHEIIGAREAKAWATRAILGQPEPVAAPVDIA